MTQHRGVTEQPANSNTDRRKDGIRASQLRLGKWLVGAAWCGTWYASALLAAGVKGVSYRQASVAYIEDDARAKRAPFGRGWLGGPAARNPRKIKVHVFRGDAVVLFGRGKHVEMFRELTYKKGAGWIIVTDGGNTSPGKGGSQANGGGAYRRERPLSEIHGFALANFPDR